MISRIRGILLETQDEYVVVEAGGLGYHIRLCTAPPQPADDGIVQLYTYLAVRETSLDLYGFADTYSREIFTALLAIPKIGPKSAQQILQKASLELLVQCVHTDDAKRLAKHSGLGPKTAEKVVSALADALPTDFSTSTDSTSPSQTAATDVTDALVALGYNEREAYDAATAIATNAPELANDTSAAVTRALQHLSRHS